MSADHVFDTLGVAGEELGKIFEDEKIIDKLSILDVKPDDESIATLGLRKIKDMLFLITVFSKTYRIGIYKIIAEFKQTTVEEIGKLPLTEIWAQIMDSLNDELFLSFFPQLRSLVRSESLNILSKQGLAEPN